MVQRVISRIRHLLVGCGLMAVVLCLLGTPALAAAKYEWKFANPLTLPWEDALLQKFCDKVAEYSKGQIALKYYPNGQLGTHDETFHGLQGGTIEVAIVQPYINLVPGAIVGWMPWTVTSWKEFGLAYDRNNGPLAKLMEVAMDEVGVWPLVYRANGGPGFANRMREIKTPDDFKGLKFRVSSALGHVRTLANMAEGSGATFETMPMADAYNALSKGVVDAMWDTWLEMITLRHGEVLKYYTDLKWAWDLSAISINKELWESLPADLKAAISKAADEVQPEIIALAQKTEEDMAKQAKSMFPNLKITEVTDEQRAMFQQKANMPAVWAELCTPWLDKKYPGQNMTEKTLKAVEEIQAQARK